MCRPHDIVQEPHVEGFVCLGTGGPIRQLALYRQARKTMERETSLELATSTLARLRSTN